MAKRKNLVSFLLDRTGSMGVIWESTVGGFNEFVKEQVKNKDYKTVWNLTVFDSEGVDLIHEGVKGKNMPKLADDDDVVYPRGMTPLHDAIARTIKATDQIADDFDGVIFVILTDGEENASTEYTLKQVYDLIRAREDKKNWQFIFLGANMDAYKVGVDYGIQKGQTVTFEATEKSVVGTYAVAAASTASYASTGQTVTSHEDTTEKGNT